MIWKDKLNFIDKKYKIFGLKLYFFLFTRGAYYDRPPMGDL